MKSREEIRKLEYHISNMIIYVTGVSKSQIKEREEMYPRNNIKKFQEFMGKKNLQI